MACSDQLENGFVSGDCRPRRKHLGARSGRHRSGTATARTGAAPPRLGGVREDAAGRARGGAGLPGALHAPHGHRQRAAGGRRRRQGALQGPRRQGRRQAHRCTRRSAVHRRLLQHVLPSGFKRIRHYGLLASAAKTERLAMPAANPQAREDAQAFMRRVAAIDVACCQHCRLGRWRWRLMQEIPADRAAPGSIVPVACRGPP